MKQRTLFILVLLLTALSLWMIFYGCGDDDDDNDDNNDNDDATGDDDDDNDDNDDNDTGDDDDEAIDVPATAADGVDTGIDVAEGDTLTVTATGTVTLTAGGQTASPDGVTGQTCNDAQCPMPDENWGGLVAMVVDESSTKAGKDQIVNCLFWLGTNFGQSAACGGRLRLLVNDFNYDDNSGSFSVLITHGSAAGKTWVDSTTGLEWEKQAKTGDPVTYDEADEYCNTLTLDGKTGWRLPNIDELRSLVRDCADTETDGDCALTDDCNTSACFNENSGACGGCEQNEGPADGCYWPDEIGGICEWYYSTTRWGENVDYAWGVNYSRGAVGNHYILIDSDTSRVRCVR
ncbi:MAG TPA: DUF1566 domain-containing protein [bacterium]|nr:DUF1566 domain-containing protein [bacterium]